MSVLECCWIKKIEETELMDELKISLDLHLRYCLSFCISYLGVKS